MTEKALAIAKQEMIQTVLRERPQFDYEEAAAISEQIISEINWNDSALMHKGIKWITCAYLNAPVNV